MKRFALCAALWLTALISAPVSAPAVAAPQGAACQVSRVSDTSGMFLYLDTGVVYEPLPGRDRTAASIWLPLDRVLVCPDGGTVYRITNLSLPRPVSILAINLLLN